MGTALDLLVISASSGENLKLAERTASMARADGLQCSVLDLTLNAPPLFTPRQQALGLPEQIPLYQEQLQGAAHWLIWMPEYNGSIPPVFTSAIAWLSTLGDDFRTLFNARPVAIASHSGSGGYECLSALRIQLAHLGAHVVGRQLVCNANKPARDESIEAILKALLTLKSPT